MKKLLSDQVRYSDILMSLLLCQMLLLSIIIFSCWFHYAMQGLCPNSGTISEQSTQEIVVQTEVPCLSHFIAYVLCILPA